MYPPWPYSLYPEPTLPYLSALYSQAQTKNIQNIIILTKQVQNLSKQNEQLRKRITQLSNSKNQNYHNYKPQYQNSVSPSKKTTIKKQYKNQQNNPSLTKDNIYQSPNDVKNVYYKPRQSYSPPPRVPKANTQKKYNYSIKQPDSDQIYEYEAIQQHDPPSRPYRRSPINPQRVHTEGAYKNKQVKNNKIYLKCPRHKNSSFNKLKNIKKISQTQINSAINHQNRTCYRQYDC